MAAGGKRRRTHSQATKRSQAEADEIAALEARIAAGAPDPGMVPGAGAPRDGADAAAAGTHANGVSYADARRFDELPLSSAALDALREAKFVALTAIQRAALPHALAGRDVLGAAKTGSGKTLAFLVPVRSFSWVLSCCTAVLHEESIANI